MVKTNDSIELRVSINKGYEIKEMDKITDEIIGEFSIEELVDKIKDYIEKYYTPQEIFDEDVLDEWAVDHGYE